MVVTDMVLLPAPPAIEVGLKVAVAPAGNPLALKAIAPVKPPVAVAVTV